MPENELSIIQQVLVGSAICGGPATVCLVAYYWLKAGSHLPKSSRSNVDKHQFQMDKDDFDYQKAVYEYQQGQNEREHLERHMEANKDEQTGMLNLRRQAMREVDLQMAAQRYQASLNWEVRGRTPIGSAEAELERHFSGANPLFTIEEGKLAAQLIKNNVNEQWNEFYQPAPRNFIKHVEVQKRRKR